MQNPFAVITKELIAYRKRPVAERWPRADQVADMLAELGCPAVVSAAMLVDIGASKQACHHILAVMGYDRLSNPESRYAQWCVDYKRFTLYARRDLSRRDALFAASKFLGDIRRG